MVSFLHPDVEKQAAALADEFARAQPFRHVVIEPFLDSNAYEQLLTQFPAFTDEQARSEDGSVGGKAVFSNLAEQGPAYQKFDALMQDEAFLALVVRITRIDRLLYDPEYVGGGTHDNRNGQELDTHVDSNY